MRRREGCSSEAAGLGATSVAVARLTAGVSACHRMPAGRGEVVVGVCEATRVRHCVAASHQRWIPCKRNPMPYTCPRVLSSVSTTPDSPEVLLQSLPHHYESA